MSDHSSPDWTLKKLSDLSEKGRSVVLCLSAEPLISAIDEPGYLRADLVFIAGVKLERFIGDCFE